MLTHPEIIVGTPDGNLLSQAMIKRMRKAPGAPLEIGKDPISIFAPYELETRLKESIELHRFPPSLQHYREIERGEPRSLPFAVDLRSAAVATTRPATLVSYSARS